ncbi:FYVE, RhoGEF and PH domain-containing protein 6-like isoform X2 [Antennarius striatus]|uniref:FYVE, RhoGEF and PH domain-containing protein 6-like isoform X2 n=1 Tax=Antennarius striatus TaxID=241820 RepID=UPI0035B478B2
MRSSGMHKPPLAPKPKLPLPERPEPEPSAPKREGVLPPGTPKRVKPAIAPKPCLSKHTNVVESKPLASKTVDQTPGTKTPRILNSQQGVPQGLQKGVHQETKKSDFVYIIPICVCNHENCVCMGKTSAGINKMDKDLKMLVKCKPEGDTKPLPTPRHTSGNNREKILASSNYTHLTSHKPPPDSLTEDRNLNTGTVIVRPAPLLRTWTDETNGNEMPQKAPEKGPEDNALGSEEIYSVPRSKPVPVDRRKHVHNPVQWKPRTPVLTHQEKVEAVMVENVVQEGRDTNVKEVKVSSEWMGNSSPSTSRPVEIQPIFLSMGKPGPPCRKKPFLSAPEKASTSAALTQEDDLGWDSSSQETEASVDKDDDDVDREGTPDPEAIYTDFTHSPPCNRFLDQQELTHSPEVIVPVKVVSKKLQRHSSMTESVHRKNIFSEEKQERELGDSVKMPVLPIEDCVLKEILMRELPSPPTEKTTKNFFKGTPMKPSRPSVGKAKSFSSADVRSDGHKKNQFLKLLDMKLSAKMLPKLRGKGDKSFVDTGNDNQESYQDGCENCQDHLEVNHKFSNPIEKEQSVDGDEFFPDVEQEPYYENIPYYEEIPIYMNFDGERAVTTPQASYSQPTPQTMPDYDDEGIYEEHEPYMSFGQPPTHCERSSVDEEVARQDDVSWDNDDFDITSDEEGDSSSISSKGDLEQPDQSLSEKKRIKIRHIAEEIASSESVFVDVLKLLHVDFRDAVTKASSQNKKPVIEERLLNQILYYLPQLYALNQELLKELKHRLVDWDENSQLSDIFLKKGPFLKMYSTYIMEFDRNAALLVEQSKRNSAFGAVVRDFEASPRCANLALKHYLLKPVQRIPQYQLLLTDYLKNLSEDSADYNDTQAALALVKEVANHANDILKQGDNFQKLMQLQCSLTSHHEIVQPGRTFLKEGMLKKLSRKVMQPRMFFLFSDTFLHTIPAQSGQYKFKNMLSLAGMKVRPQAYVDKLTSYAMHCHHCSQIKLQVSKPSQEAYQNELNIVSVERSFILSASSAAERDEWLEAMSTAISDYTKKKISFLSGKAPEEVELQDGGDDAPLGSKAPIWIPDPRTTMCMICTCEFTPIWRRHHCRACGKVVCQNCSSKKHSLKYRNNKIVRVCDQCFPVLQNQKGDQNPSMTVSTGNKTPSAFNRKQKKIPALLKEVTANTDSSMSGYLQRSKNKKKHWKRLWFVIKDKVLYTYAASEDVAALESQPLLGFVLKFDSSQTTKFKLYHQKTLYYNFKADDIPTTQRWIASFKEATVL